jgi:5-methyltetrahydropteroyltriglutamate--homocysteine methyltransferase
MPAQLDGLPILPTSVVGSHGIPGWVHLTRDEAARGTLAAADLAEVYDDATKLALLDQERAGVDVVSDGEMRRLHFIQGFYSRLNGLHAVGIERRLGAVGYDQVPGYVVRDRVTAPDGLGIVSDFTYARSQTQKPLKATCPGPLTLTLPIKEFGPYGERTELAGELGRIINCELKALVAAGARFIQLDEPSMSFFEVPPHTMASLINRAVDGVEAKLALHVCFGNFHGHPRTSRSYRRIFPGLLEAKVDQFALEFANREMAEIGLWREIGADRELAVGVVDVKSYYPETTHEVARRIRLALQQVPADKVWVTADCGFNHTPRHACVAKLHAMVDGARIVRQELTGQAEPAPA